MRRNDDPPETESAYEVKVDGVWFAWDEDCNLYQQYPMATRADGYLYIGKYYGDEANLIRHIRKVRHA